MLHSSSCHVGNDAPVRTVFISCIYSRDIVYLFLSLASLIANVTLTIKGTYFNLLVGRDKLNLDEGIVMMKELRSKDAILHVYIMCIIYTIFMYIICTIYNTILCILFVLFIVQYYVYYLYLL